MLYWIGVGICVGIGMLLAPVVMVSAAAAARSVWSLLKIVLTIAVWLAAGVGVAAGVGWVVGWAASWVLWYIKGDTTNPRDFAMLAGWFAGPFLALLFAAAAAHARALEEREAQSGKTASS